MIKTNLIAARAPLGRSSLLGLVAFMAAGILPSAALAQDRTPYDAINATAASSPVTAMPLRGNVSLLQGSGGNIGVLSGPDGFFLVDTGIAVSKEKIAGVLETIGEGRIRYAVNTHWHWDHADGNAWVRGTGATIVASRNTARRLAQTIRVEEWQHTFTPNPPGALPNMLITSPKTIDFNGEAILIRPYAHGHTDGDLSVYFPKADVLLTGDTWWNGGYPFVDYVGGGSIDGFIRLANANIALAGRDTLVVPGHGPAGTRQQLIETRDMLVKVRERVARLKAKGMSLEEVLIARPTADLDAQWGAALVNGELFTRLVYRGV